MLTSWLLVNWWTVNGSTRFRWVRDSPLVILDVTVLGRGVEAHYRLRTWLLCIVLVSLLIRFLVSGLSCISWLARAAVFRNATSSRFLGCCEGKYAVAWTEVAGDCPVLWLSS